MKFKQAIGSTKTNGERILANLWDLTEASCLMLIAGFALYQAHTNAGLNYIFAKVLFVAAIVIALRSAQLFIKHLNK